MTAARRRILTISAILLLVLDAGRSLYARIGSATPTRLLSPDPSYAQAIAWPPGSNLPPGAALGARVYARNCAVCHGPNGKGNGPAAPSLRPRPRDFTRGVFKLKSTPGGEAPLLADLRGTLQRGMPGSSMPAWHDILSGVELDAVAEYVRDLGTSKTWGADSNVTDVPTALLEGASSERGRSSYTELGCPACHGAEGRGDGASANDLKDVWGQADPPRDLTEPWSFRGGSSAASVYVRIANGLSGTPMPGYSEVATTQQLADVVAYLHSVAKTPAWKEGGTLSGAGQSADAVRRGEYLVRAGMCGLCHTPVDTNGIYLGDTHYLAGGMKVEAGAHGIFFTRNLTSDAETGLGKWKVEEIATAIRTGHTRERRLSYWGMPWMVLGQLTRDDALAMATYLKTVPAVHNLIPLPLQYGLIETVGRKLGYGWPAVMPARLSYFSGNYGYEGPATWRRDRPQSVLVWLQIIVVGLSALLFLLAPSSERGGGLAIALSLFALVIGAILVLVGRYPALNVVPAENVVAAFASAIPSPKLDGLPPHQAALLERGRYLYGIASCPYCHGGNGAAGGKVNWKAFGTTWSANLSAHASGLLGWSDEAVLRAMTSGVSRDGRPLHWQAMIWDHLSNYAAEDQLALLAYVRSLPAVEHTNPSPLPRQGDDCSGDTFWIGATSLEAGCK